MDVFFYGRLGERVGRQVNVEVPEGGCAVTELRRLIASQHPQISDEIVQQRVRACVADDIVPESFRVSEGQTVEFFPPVSGG
jgi:molybdopterin converting factor small subunit